MSPLGSKNGWLTACSPCMWRTDVHMIADDDNDDDDDDDDGDDDDDDDDGGCDLCSTRSLVFACTR